MTAAADNEGKRSFWAGRALQWWLGELRGTIADIAGALERKSRHGVTLEAGERYWILRQRQGVIGQIDRASLDASEVRAALSRIARMVRAGSPIVVEIPQERVLTKRITLPAAAQGDLARVLRFEIARHFPFPAERVHFGHRILARAGGAIEVEIAAVAREEVAAICDALAEAGLQPSGIVLAGEAGGTPLAAPLRKASPSRANKALLMSLLVAAVAASVSPVVHDRMRLAAVEHEIAAVKPQAQAALDAREKARQEAARTAGPLRLARARPPLVAVLDSLTRAVPDGSWLLSLSVSGREVVMDGLSPSAASVTLALENSHGFSHIVFRAPITRDAKTGLEHFAISALLAEPKP
jgi:general secretion pathway protein L